ncbi:MAG TPA: response regulator [bacterium]|jgi:DNA-binding NtrC family response regulator|nr:response regulator [bacterium]
MSSKHRESAQKLEPHPGIGGEAKPFRILVADGGLFLTDFIRKYLETAGHSVLTAASAQEALEITSSQQPDLVLLDSGLDGVNGMALLADLLLVHDSGAVIVMARQPAIAEAVEAIKLGAMDYFDGPLETHRLDRAIESQRMLYKGGEEADDAATDVPGSEA